MKGWTSILALGGVAVGSFAVLAQNEVAPLPPVLGERAAARRAICQAEGTATESLPAETIAPPPRQAHGPRPLTLVDAEQMALANHPALARAAAKVQAARGAWVQAGLAPNPVVGWAADEMGDQKMSGMQGAFASQEFITAGKLGLNRAVASHDIRRQEAELEAVRYRVLSDVQAGFYDALVAQQSMRLMDELVGIADASVETTDVLHRKGELSRVDFLQARIEANTTRLLRDTIRHRHAAALRRLSALLGGAELPNVPLAGDARQDLRELSWDDALGRLLAESPEVAAAGAMVDRASWALARAQAEWIPNVELMAMVQHDNASQYDIATVQIGLPLPVFDRNQGGIQQAQAEVAAANSNVMRVEFDLKRRLAASFEDFSNARRRVAEYDREILRDAKESLDLVMTGYRNGEFGYLTVLTTQRTFVETNLAYLDALRQLREAVAAIDGMLLKDSLAAGGD
jgi:cobalt-zinc-cadmium efflux system outer membrane protein